MYSRPCVGHVLQICISVSLEFHDRRRIIKHYEYAMIPYILAENPKISRKDAFFLSKQLMNKNKWRVFLLDCSFLGWKILSILTLGILDFIFVNPYITGCKAELYASLRRDYVLSRSPRYEMLSRFLFGTCSFRRRTAYQQSSL